MVVGITININSKLFSNGLGQNAIFLYDVLEKIDSISELCLVVFDKNFNSEKLSALDHLKGYNIVHWHENISNIDVLITVGVMPSDEDLLKFRNRENTKIVGFKGGNNLILSSEDMLFERRWGQIGKEITKPIAYPFNKKIYDEIWMVPQQEFHNKDYFEITYGCRAISTPFIWSPKFIEAEVKKITEKNPDFKILFQDKIFDKWKVTSIEPNTSILKNLMPIIHIMEWAYINNKDVFDKFNITNAEEYLNNPILIEIGRYIEINKDKKMVLDKRWPIVYALSFFSNIIISHQWGNPLNYAYLDVVYFGYPLIHNADLCKDIGYYYPNFELKKAGDLLLKVIESHKSDLDYMKRNRNIISRYTLQNKDMIKQYENLLLGLYDPSKKINGSYNWKTNLIE